MNLRLPQVILSQSPNTTLRIVWLHQKMSQLTVCCRWVLMTRIAALKPVIHPSTKMMAARQSPWWNLRPHLPRRVMWTSRQSSNFSDTSDMNLLHGFVEYFDSEFGAETNTGSARYLWSEPNFRNLGHPSGDGNNSSRGSAVIVDTCTCWHIVEAFEFRWSTSKCRIPVDQDWRRFSLRCHATCSRTRQYFDSLFTLVLLGYGATVYIRRARHMVRDKFQWNREAASGGKWTGLAFEYCHLLALPETRYGN